MNADAHEYHTPVLLTESIDALDINSNGIYVDVTFGGGGHSKTILQNLSAKGRVYAFDQDKQAEQNAIIDERFTFVLANFGFLPHFMRYYGEDEVDGILADLGVSSHHFDDPDRGFSYRFDARLDMRMNLDASKDAVWVLKHFSAIQLQDIFSKYGEIRNAKTLSKAVCQARSLNDITRVSQLLEIVDRVYRGDRQRYCAQVFQALRIEVNDEIGVLKRFLDTSIELLASKGRLVVITYHSLEDKAVKQVVKDLIEKTRDAYGRSVPKVRLITKKPILPSENEIKRNPRAASAKLRVIEKI